MQMLAGWQGDGDLLPLNRSGGVAGDVVADSQEPFASAEEP
jgi:hypothetical protein